MKTKIVLLFLLAWAGVIFGQEKINSNKINVTSQFIFDDFTKGVECTKEGDIVSATALTMPVDAIFTVVGKIEGNKYIVKFLRWNLNKTNVSNNLEYYYKESSGIEALRKTYGKTFFDTNTGRVVQGNQEVTANRMKAENTTSNIIEVTDRYFLIEKNDLLLNGIVYHPIPKFEFVFGTITYLARIRPSVKGISSTWSTDLNLGIAYGVRRNFNKNWGLAALGGLSISKIKIDSLSTSPSIKRTIEKVSLSPTLNILGNYKKFFVGVGIGFDWINLDSEESAKWLYNRKPFYAIGIGINLFSAGNNDTPDVTNKQ